VGADDKKFVFTWTNIWFYFKWHIIIGILVIFSVGFIIYTSFQKDSVDLRIFYVTENPAFYNDELINIEKTIGEYARDFNSDGKVVVQIENIFVGDKNDPNILRDNNSKLMTALRAGRNMLVMGDRTGIKFLITASALEDISNMTENTQFDGLAWMVLNSEFSKNFPEKFWQNEEEPIYFGLRVFEGTIAEIVPDNRAAYEYAKEVLDNIINNNRLKEVRYFNDYDELDE